MKNTHDVGEIGKRYVRTEGVRVKEKIKRIGSRKVKLDVSLERGNRAKKETKQGETEQ